MSGVSLYNNRFSCNNQVVSGAGAYYVNGANNGIQPGTAVLLGSEITGTTAPNRRIDVFYNPSNCLTCEGLVFYTTLISDVLGNWSTSISPTLGSWTIMETADNGSSSNFSGCQTLTFCDDLILPSSVEACLDENVVIETNATGQWYNSNETGNLNHVAQGNEVLFYIADTPEGACLDSVSVLINPGDLYYADEDMDGYGNPNNSTQSCWIPLGFVSNASDCEDSDAMVNPGMIEICNDMDDDCDLTVDEDLDLILQFSDQVHEPSELECGYVQQSELYGGANVEESANMLYKILQREGTAAQTNAVLANAGAALWVAEKAPTLADGFLMAKESLESGKAFQVFKKFIMD